MENRLSTVSACTSLQLGGLNIAYKQTTSLKIAKPFYLPNCGTYRHHRITKQTKTCRDWIPDHPHALYLAQGPAGIP